MAASLMENGKITKCTELELLHGLMEKDFVESTLKIRFKATANLFGQMGVGIEESGLMVFNMDKEFILPRKGFKK